MEENKRYVIDFHTHILPGMDDGARDAAMSLSMLSSLAAQAADQVFLTPHFVLHRESVASFLKRRQASAAELSAALKTAAIKARFPRLLLGAEVRVEPELLEAPDIKKLCYAGTDALLLEFPFMPMERRYFETLENIVYKYKVIPVIAHLERYLDLFDSQDINAILSLPNVIIQFSSSMLEAFGDKRTVLSFIKKGHRVVLGSDAHNMGERPPEIAKAYRFLESKLERESKDVFYRTMKYFTRL